MGESFLPVTRINNPLERLSQLAPCDKRKRAAINKEETVKVHPIPDFLMKKGAVRPTGSFRRLSSVINLSVPEAFAILNRFEECTHHLRILEIATSTIELVQPKVEATWIRVSS
jgi:hypothetical protein